MKILLDPRKGDVEDDASSTKSRSMLALAGSLVAEISFPKLIAAWLLIVALPCLLLGLAPLIGSAWFATFSRSLSQAYGGIVPLALILVVVVIGMYGGRTVFRVAEQAFWALNSTAVQPGYALCRELIRHFSEMLLAPWLTEAGRARLRAASAAAAGLILCAIALMVVWLVGPYTRWQAEFADLLYPLKLVVPALANSAVILIGYCAAAVFVWGMADAAMDQPRDWAKFADSKDMSKRWRVVHLSDVHIVGERYGFRLESGRYGPRGNERLARLLERLDEIDAQAPLDHILISGDITDAGRSAEWAEFFTAILRYPKLAERMLIIPGNHDINVVDRTNPARLDFPTSPGRRLREMRTLSGIAAVQGKRTHVVDLPKRRLGATLDASLAPHAAEIESFADTGRLRLSAKLAKLWAEAFPVILPPKEPDGLGFILMNSTALTHFSFTNALGLISSEQVRGMRAAFRQFPKAVFVVALHHHLIEYPKRASALSERIGTALINGSWFVRQLQRYSRRCVVMHGHRHIDWIGRCGSLRIVSAPSPVMESRDDGATYFYIHTLGINEAGDSLLGVPEKVEIAGA